MLLIQNIRSCIYVYICVYIHTYRRMMSYLSNISGRPGFASNDALLAASSAARTLASAACEMRCECVYICIEQNTYIHVSITICIYIYMYMCIYIYTIYIYIYTCTHLIYCVHSSQQQVRHVCTQHVHMLQQSAQHIIYMYV